jgi:hypothetical protein
MNYNLLNVTDLECPTIKFKGFFNISAEYIWDHLRNDAQAIEIIQWAGGILTFPIYAKFAEYQKSVEPDTFFISNFKITVASFQNQFKDQITMFEQIALKYPTKVGSWRAEFLFDNHETLVKLKLNYEPKTIEESCFKILYQINHGQFMIEDQNHKHRLVRLGKEECLKNIPFKTVDKHIEAIIGSIDGSCSSDSDQMVKLLELFEPFQLTLVEEIEKGSYSHDGWEYYSLDKDPRILSVHSYRCDIDDYAVEVFFDNIELMEYETIYDNGEDLEKRKKLKQLTTIAVNDKVYCVPFNMKDRFYEEEYQDYAIQLPLSQVKTLKLFEIKNEYVILDECYHYNPETGLNLTDI